MPLASLAATYRFFHDGLADICRRYLFRMSLAANRRSHEVPQVPEVPKVPKVPKVTKVQ